VKKPREGNRYGRTFWLGHEIILQSRGLKPAAVIASAT